jgi:hypothetical protein
VAFWTIIVEFIAGVVAKFLMSGDYEPSGFILTALLGIVCRQPTSGNRSASTARARVPDCWGLSSAPSF